VAEQDLHSSQVAGLLVLVFRWTTIAPDRTRPPLTRSPVLILTTSQAAQLAVDCQVNMARSRTRPSWSSQNRIAQTCCGSARASHRVSDLRSTASGL
jgi:hypothetical protein